MRVHPHLVNQAVVDGRLHGVAQQDAVAGVDVAVGHVELDAAVHVDPRAHHDKIALRHFHPFVALTRQLPNGQDLGAFLMIWGP